ncbi:MAG: hypothetical protein CM15mP105_1580 [Methanobacteriota archaeon]|nr:MAG: hypothetical protein CM15mP105_1580 [Euryarchaeota archaeon]
MEEPNNRIHKSGNEDFPDTGDLDGLSETDLSLLALVIDIKGHLYTDDYRIQNVAVRLGLSGLRGDGWNLRDLEWELEMQRMWESDFRWRENEVRQESPESARTADQN